MANDFIEPYEEWLKIKKGLPRPLLTALAYSISGFAERKYAKPAHERYMQVPPNAARAINDALTRR